MNQQYTMADFEDLFDTHSQMMRAEQAWREELNLSDTENTPEYCKALVEAELAFRQSLEKP